MNRRRFFLRWSVLPSLMLVGALFVANLGWFTTMHDGDRTRLTYLILFIFLYGSLLAGRLAWRLSRLQEGEEEKADSLKSKLGHAPFLEGLCERLGLLGTLFGVSMMLSGGFGGIAEGGDVAQESLRTLTTGMATAIISTLVGYICSILLKVQFHFIEHRLEEIER